MVTAVPARAAGSLRLRPGESVTAGAGRAAVVAVFDDAAEEDATVADDVAADVAADVASPLPPPPHPASAPAATISAATAGRAR